MKKLVINLADGSRKVNCNTFVDICVNLVIGNSSCRDEETTGRIYRSEREFTSKRFPRNFQTRSGLRFEF
jgi:hypothetical protein